MTYDYESIKFLGEHVGFRVERREYNQGHPQIIKETMGCLPEISLIIEMTKD